MSIDALIKDLGGTTAVADGIGVPAPVVSNWRARGRIPPEHWLAVIGFAKATKVRGLTFERLAGLQRARVKAESRA